MGGSLKISKPFVLFRSILDLQNFSYHKPARWLVNILDLIHKVLTLHCKKNSFELVNVPGNIPLTSHKIFSIDVDSLFTSVPLQETIDSLWDFVFSSNIPILISIDYLQKLFRLHLRDIQLSFEFVACRQIDGVAMGNPLDLRIANVC